ncbi:extracellular solute-binding protein [Actinopolymorpha singaporensis]
MTLTWWVLSSANEVAWAKALAEDFHKLHPSITVRVQKSAQVGDLKAVVAATVAHKLPDLLFSADVFTTTEASKGVLLDLSPYLAAYHVQPSDFLGKIMQLGVYRGKQYVVPRGMDQIVTLYNPALFRRFGVPEPREGWTWDEFVAASAKLTRKVGGTQYYAMGSGGNTHASYPVYVPFMRGWGGDLTNGDQATLDDPKVARGVTELMDYARKYTPWFRPPPKDPFLAGFAAMEWAQRPVVYGCCINQDRTKWTSTFTPKFVNFPLLPTPKIGAGMAGWGAAADTKHPHEAAAFLMYTLSRRGQEVYSKAAGEVPVRTDLKDSTVWREQIPDGKNLDQRAFVDFTQYQSFPPSNLPLATDAQMSQAITTMFDSVRLRKASVAEALKQANQTVNSALSASR